MNDTIFDKILAGDIPADIVFEDEVVMAFRDVNPQAPQHVLVIPKKRAARLADTVEWTDAEQGAFFRRVAMIASRLGLDSDGYRIVVNNGAGGGQEVEYLHAHILGGRKMNWPPG